MDTQLMWVVAAVVVVAVLVIAWMVVRRQRSVRLRQRFGPNTAQCCARRR